VALKLTPVPCVIWCPMKTLWVPTGRLSDVPAW